MKRRINILCLIALFAFFCSAIHTGCRKSARHETSSDAYRRTKTTLKISGGIIRKKSFKSSKKSIVSVTSKGKLTAKKPVNVKLRQPSSGNRKEFPQIFQEKLYCKVTVQNKKESSLTFRSNHLLMEHFFETWCRVSLFIRCRVSARSKSGNKRPKCSP